MVGILPKEGLVPADVATRVTDRIVGHLQPAMPLEQITSTTALSELGADSLDAIEIVMLLEDDFSIEITDEAMDRIVTLGGAAQVVTEALAAFGRPVAAGSA